MGLSMEGFEGEFLELMTKVNQTRIKGKEKRVNGSTRYERELKKLKWTVNEGRKIRSGASRKGARDTIVVL